MNKQTLKLETEKRILALLINEYELIPESRLILSVNDFSETYKTAFQILTDLTEPTETDIFINLRDIESFNFFDVTHSYTDFMGLSGLKKLANDLFNQNDSIEHDKFLTDLLNENKKRINPVETGTKLFDYAENYLNQKSDFNIESFENDLNAVYEEIENEIHNKIHSIKSTYFPSFNKLTNGIRESNLIGIAGSYKSGKTSFVTALLIDFAEQNIPVCLFSLELSKREIISKIVSYKTGIQYSHLLNPKELTENEIQELNRIKQTANKLSIYTPAGTLNISEIKTKIRNLRDRRNVKIFFIDYIGYIQSNNKDFNSRERELTFFSNQLKQIAKELGITIFAVAQLNRQGLNEPTSNNLAESISLARDCDYLLTIAPAERLKKELRPKDTENKFVVFLDTSRHSKQGEYFIIGVVNNGLKEILRNNEYSQEKMF